MIRRWLNRLLESAPVKTVIRFAKKVRPWGFEGLSLYAVARFFIEGMQKGALTTRAAAISFRFFLAVFPVIILLLSLIPFIPIDNFQQYLFDSVRAFFPGDTFSLVEETVEDLLNKSHNTVFSLGFILSVYYASNSVNAILTGFNGSVNLESKGNPLLIRLVSIGLLIILSVFIIIAVALIIFSGAAFRELIEVGLLQQDNVLLLNIAKWLITVLLIYGSITILYNIGDLRRHRWKTFSAGATVTTLLFILTSLGFAWFVNNFSSFNRLYGSLGTFLLLLIWINLNSLMLLVGFELNASIYRAKSDLLKLDEE